ncbi:MAG TPA: mannosyltransferase family protein [Ktedonobacterales bacterium]|nr:mannosyltransferase family protein [Ktedonobacterales bacterium]
MGAEIALEQTAQTSTATAAPAERPLWRSAVAAWLGQRLLIGALVAVWQVTLHTFSPAAFYRVWTLYDGIFYTLIAERGYRLLTEAAYFPLYPLLMHMTAPLVGGHVRLAGLIVANACALAAFILLGRLVAHEFGAGVARQTLFYYAIFPTGLFFASIYTESLFLLLSVGAFLCIRQRRWLLAGVVIALATLTRAPGALLLLPLTIEAWRALRPAWSAMSGARRLRVGLTLVSASALPVCAFLALQLYLTHLYGIPNVLSRAADDPAWLRYLDWPWAGVMNDFATLADGSPFIPVLEIVKDVTFLGFWLGLSLVMLLPRGWTSWTNIPRAWVAYGWASLLQVLVLPAHIRGGALMSVPRYMLVIFPCFVLLALVSERHPNVRRLAFALCILWTVMLTRLLADASFVA